MNTNNLAFAVANSSTESILKFLHEVVNICHTELTERNQDKPTYEMLEMFGL